MLTGKTIWITRPEGQADKLISALTEQGASIRHLPMLAITPLEPDAQIRNIILDLDRYDLLFFISTNAARLGMELIDKYWPQFPSGTQVYAVGPTSADVVSEFGVAAAYPQARMSSEALLAMDSLQDIEGKKALIVRGVGGRELLATALQERGVDVTYLELYRRTCPTYLDGRFGDLMTADNPDSIVVTSAEALENLAGLLDRDGVSLEAARLCVSSRRIADEAGRRGFTDTFVMPGADDQAIISSLQERL
jgi:uroporphyrinogen-III synthase